MFRITQLSHIKCWSISLQEEVQNRRTFYCILNKLQSTNNKWFQKIKKEQKQKIATIYNTSHSKF